MENKPMLDLYILEYFSCTEVILSGKMTYEIQIKIMLK